MQTRNLTLSIASLCMRAQGDIGPYTTYSNQNQIVVFLKAWLRDPASPAQIKHRDRIRACAASWQATTVQTRKDYQRAAEKCSMYINGYNLWVSMSMNRLAIDCLPTIRRQSGINLPLPPFN
jgi:hypothetical protein